MELPLDQSGPPPVRGCGQVSLRRGATWSSMDIRTNLGSDGKEEGEKGYWVGSSSGAVGQVLLRDLHCFLPHSRRVRLR